LGVVAAAGFVVWGVAVPVAVAGAASLGVIHSNTITPALKRETSSMNTQEKSRETEAPPVSIEAKMIQARVTNTFVPAMTPHTTFLFIMCLLMLSGSLIGILVWNT